MKFGLSDEDINKINNILKEYPIEKAIIFGSRAKGNYKDGSDIDLAILADIKFKELLEIKVRYDELFIPYKLDIIDYKKIKSKELKEHIKRVGKVFYAKSI
jgi:predicted nucleotidyltransferase